MRVSSRLKSPRGRGENDAIETEAEPRFLLRHSRPEPKYSSNEKDSHNLVSYLLRKWPWKLPRRLLALPC